MAASNPPPTQLFPTNASFSIPPSTSIQASAPSVISSRMTDAASEDEDEYQPEGLATRHSSTKRANDPDRPPSSMSRPSTRAAPSRRGTPFSGTSAISAGWRTGGAFGFGGPGGSISNTSRPQSATSRTSKTHVPSLASQAFFRPMSSQRLQAQRKNRPMVFQDPPRSADEHSESESNLRRHSLGSNATSQPGTGEHLKTANDAVPPSRGTEYTEQDRYTTNASHTGNATAQSVGESEKPLQQNPSKVISKHSDTSKGYKQASSALPANKSSQNSFRANFLLPARSNISSRNDTREHHRLGSATPSKSAPSVHDKEAVAKPGVNYQYFSGNTVFCWGGRLQNTRDRPINIGTAIIVVLPSALFFAFSAPFLWHNVSPVIPVFFAYFFYICISSLVHASVTNPGILPRNLHPMIPPENSDDPLTLGPPTSEWIMVKSTSKYTAAMDVPTKYCKTCNIWRPLRCHHCRICDNCIETQDHHCVWINNCVGRRNYRYFLSFIAFGTMLGVFLTFASLGHCLRYQSSEGLSFAQSISYCRVPFAMFLYGLLATPYPLSLWIYHLVLMGRGETTREYLNNAKFLKKDRHRPFNQGSIWRNWLVVILRPKPPSYLHFKEKYEEGDQRFGPRRGKRTAPLTEEQQGGAMELQNVRGFQGPTALRRPRP